jgi:hypothetical protein
MTFGHDTNPTNPANSSNNEVDTVLSKMVKYDSNALREIAARSTPIVTTTSPPAIKTCRARQSPKRRLVVSVVGVASAVA